MKRIDKARPLSAFNATAGAWKLRNSFKKNKARTELARALSRGNSFVHGRKQEHEQRGTGGKLIEQKYAAHNAAFKHDEDVETETAAAEGDGEYREPEASAKSPVRPETPRRNPEPSSDSLGKDVQHPQSPEHQQRLQRQHGHDPARQPSGVNMSKFSSFSSSDSVVSYDQPQHRRDTSLTSGELTSLSSQADTARGRESHQDRPAESPEKRDSKGEGTGENKAVVVIPGMKLVDSGFDEDSASVLSDVSCNVSPNVSGEACTCSCQSETVTGSETCSCDCSQCRYGHSGSPRHSGWSESQSSCGTWSNSNSFSSYDVQMHRRKLPSKPKGIGGATEEHVLGPDEQYPVHPPSSSTKPQSKPQVGSPNRLSPQGRQNHRHHHHHHHHTHRSHSHAGGSTSSKESSSAASRRYRELTQKGVPLRVSVVDDGANLRADRRHAGKHWSSFPGQDGSTAEVIEEEEDGPDNALYQDLEAQGFFESTDSASSKSSPTRHRKRSVSKRLEMVQGAHADGVSYNHFSDLPPIPSLEDIIREIPDETGDSCSGDETKAFLNRPESELSVKALKPPAPKPPTDRLPYGHKDGGIPIADLHREPRVVHDAELVIDRIFSRAHPANTKGSESFVDPALGLDEAAIRELAMLPPVQEVRNGTSNNLGSNSGGDGGGGSGQGDAHVPLLRGTDSKHVRYVRSLSDKVDLLSAKDLLPADPRNFDILRRRLQHTGSFGTIGLQVRSW